MFKARNDVTDSGERDGGGEDPEKHDKEGEKQEGRGGRPGWTITKHQAEVLKRSSPRKDFGVILGHQQQDVFLLNLPQTFKTQKPGNVSR